MYEKVTKFIGKLYKGELFPKEQIGDGSDENPYIIQRYSYDEIVYSFIERCMKLFQTAEQIIWKF